MKESATPTKTRKWAESLQEIKTTPGKKQIGLKRVRLPKYENQPNFLAKACYQYHTYSQASEGHKSTTLSMRYTNVG